MTQETIFQRKVREKREREAAEAAARGEVTARPEDADLVPDADSGYARSEDDNAIDQLVERIGIVEAYDRWIKKPRPPQRSGKTEGFMVSCPMPNHPDRHPSAWMNLDKKTWFCPGCSLGGDHIDLAAIGFGFSVPDYRSKGNKQFWDVKQQIAQDYGYVRVALPGKREDHWIAPADTPDPTPEAPPVLAAVPPLQPAGPATAPPTPVATPTPEPVAPAAAAGPGLASVTPIDLYGDLDDEDSILPTLDWRQLITPNTFLDVYMRQCTVDDVPEEFHFWNGLLAISVAIGRDITLTDANPVLGNIFICVLGRTGQGKSRSISHLMRLTEAALIYDPTDPNNRGAKTISIPGSGEALVSQFCQPKYDDKNPKVILGYEPVRGVVEFPEMSSLISRGSRMGSNLKQTLMDFFDGKPRITTYAVTSGNMRAENAFASTITSTQPKALKDLISAGDAESGFLNRWVFVTGTDKKRMPLHRTPVNIMPCVDPLVKIHEWSSDPIPRQIGWESDAEEEFIRFFYNVIDPIQRADKTDMLARLDLIFKKLCVLFTSNEMLENVSLDVVKKVEFIFDYLVEVARVPQSQIGMSEARIIEDRIIKIIEDWETKHPNSPGCPRPHIMKYMNNKKFDRTMIEKALGVLERLGHISVSLPTKAAGPGRPPAPVYKKTGGE